MPRPDDAPPPAWTRAVAANQRAWFTRCAVATGGPTGRIGAVPWAMSPTGAREIHLVLDPGQRAAEVVDEAVQQARAVSAGSLGWWVVTAGEGSSQAPALIGRGFEIGWRPRWMWVSPSSLRSPSPGPAVEVGGPDGTPFAPDLPYGADLPPTAVQRLLDAHPGDVAFAWAVDGGEVVGQVAAHVTRDAVPVAMVYSCGVAPAHRGRGLGRHLTDTVVRWAFSAGITDVLLNATAMGAPVYEALGFVDVGEGATWWLHDVHRTPTEPERILAELVASDDADGLAAAAGPDELLDRVLPCGLTPFRLAGEMRAHAAAEWLWAHGAAVDVVAAWDLGWRRRLPSILARQPAARDSRAGPMGAGPLHEAAQRGDRALADLLLGAGADPELRDASLGLRPVDWARHFGHVEVADAIEGGHAG